MKKAVIIGGGVSGIAAKKLAEREGFSCCIVSDSDTELLPEADLIIASPGVPPLKSNLYQQALRSGTEFIGELEFGFRFWKRPLIAVTGTNGKTTTTGLLEHLLQQCGVNARSAGNIGRPLSDLVLDDDVDVAVVEVSNFQLELAPEFAPDAAALLNLESDHIDRYAGGFEEYCRVKKQIFNRVPREKQVWGMSLDEAGFQRRVTFDKTVMCIDGKPLLDQKETDLPGAPNAENLAAATELILRCNERLICDDPARFIAAVKSFRRAAHRIETVASGKGLCFVNDSKGTNPAAVSAALDAMTAPVVIMLGGLAKGMDFSILREKAGKVRCAVLFGQDRADIAAVLEDLLPCHDCGNDFDAAFALAVKLASPGDTVLLSPGCASMDMFKDYKERGERFRQAVKSFLEL